MCIRDRYWSVKNALHQSSYVPRVEAESFSPPEPKPVTTPEKKPLTLRQDKVPYGTEVYSQPRIPSISKPVSYTHLDVYKRQRSYSPIPESSIR